MEVPVSDLQSALVADITVLRKLYQILGKYFPLQAVCLAVS